MATIGMMICTPENPEVASYPKAKRPGTRITMHVMFTDNRNDRKSKQTEITFNDQVFHHTIFKHASTHREEIQVMKKNGSFSLLKKVNSSLI